MKKTFLLIILILSFIKPTWALDVGEITSFIYSNSNTLSKEISNPSTSGRLININIVRITSPLPDGKIIPMESKDEILLTPTSVLLPAKSNEIIRFFYKGPEDDKERYYRIIWFDQSLSETQQNDSQRSAVATASARISTILVVAPRQIRYNHQFVDGKIVNTGNATLRIIAYGPCLKPTQEGECKENYYLLPGKSRSFSRVDISKENGRIAFWQAEHFYPVK